MIYRRLTDRQRRFVREYPVDLNATQAAIRAGYSRAGAGQRGHIVRHSPAVAAAIDVALAERARLVGITAERVLFEVALLGFANIMDYVDPGGNGAAGLDLSRLTRDQAAAIVALQVDEGGAGGRARRVTIRLADKSRNLELIGRHLGLFARAPARGRANANTNANAKGEGAPGAVRQLSDLELSQRIRGILARGRKAGAR